MIHVGSIVAGEVERLIRVGATEAHWDRRPPDADYIILADPEGNRFCVVDISQLSFRALAGSKRTHHLPPDRLRGQNGSCYTPAALSGSP